MGEVYTARLSGMNKVKFLELENHVEVVYNIK